MSTPHGHGRKEPVHRHAFHPHPPGWVAPFRAFIAYADLTAARRATTTIADVARHARHRVELHPILWRFDQLAHGHWRERSLAAAREADVVVLATSEGGALPPHVESWVDAFLAANRGHAATIVAVCGPSEAWTISLEETADADNDPQRDPPETRDAQYERAVVR